MKNNEEDVFTLTKIPGFPKDKTWTVARNLFHPEAGTKKLTLQDLLVFLYEQGIDPLDVEIGDGLFIVNTK